MVKKTAVGLDKGYHPIGRAGVLLTCVLLLLGLFACGDGDEPIAGQGITPTPSGVTEKGRKIINYETPPEMAIDQDKVYQAVMETNKGTITFQLFPKEAPLTVNNFVFLAREGYYDGVIFHRVIKNFMVQGGDPTGTGAGGPGYRFADEPVTRDYIPGTLAMANAGPNTNGSQFFIVHGATASLPKAYNIFGLVIEGLEVVDNIASVPVGPSNSGERSKPLEELVIKSVKINESP